MKTITHKVFLMFVICSFLACNKVPQLSISWSDEILTIHGDHLPGDSVQVWYIEAFCRNGSHETAWEETVIGHQSKLISASPKEIILENYLDDGMVAHHIISVKNDEIIFDVTISNPTEKASEAHWAQPCIRVDGFTGLGQDDYVQKSFLIIDDQLAMMPDLPQWAMEARYTPGQVWRPVNVDPDDVNPRPLSPIVPDNGLIGCFSEDNQLILATAWEPWQELFQGVIVCLHSDFRIGGLVPGETKNIKGKIYIVENDIDALIQRYKQDFNKVLPHSLGY